MVVAHISEEGLVHKDGPSKGQQVVTDQYFQSNDELVRFLTSKGKDCGFVVRYVNPEALEMAIHCVPNNAGEDKINKIVVQQAPKPKPPA